MTEDEIRKAVGELAARTAKERESTITELANGDHGIPEEFRPMIRVMLRTAWISGRNAERDSREGLEAIIKKHRADNDQKKIPQDSDPVGDPLGGSDRGS